MVVSFSALMRPWLDDLDGLDWLHFRGHRLTSLRYIRDVSIRPELLRAATQFWDPEVHVFRFGLHELCPTVEEFFAYLGGFDLAEPIVPLYGVGFAPVLSSKLEISNNAAKSLIRGGFLNIPRLIEGFRSNNFALCLCLLAAFLFVQSDGQASSSLVGVAMQIEERKDVAPMVLAETLMGLDGVHAGRTDVFEGSPLLLQVGFSLSSPFSGFSLVPILPQRSVQSCLRLLTCFLSFTQLWLCDKANLLEPVPRNQVHETQGFVIRNFKEVFDGVGGWIRVLSQLTEEVISWRLTWIDLPNMAISNMGRQRVILAGLTRWTFYIPNRILRQLGARQVLPPAGPEDFVIPNFNVATFRAYQRNWRERTTIPRDLYPSVLLPTRYKRWLTRDIEARDNGN
ncbi:hypothetical protein Vadar_008555 [Vaccinium darrowii]|uniref:Uncharacterized protein n=1 Tax=Vaccinium darrowii TaxID=229202 RepID=A0ACB7XGK3_9ERIC|nr:hypothetical protein Vadar_008555 [Vaccinium darrowii]